MHQSQAEGQAFQLTAELLLVGGGLAGESSGQGIVAHGGHKGAECTHCRDTLREDNTMRADSRHCEELTVAVQSTLPPCRGTSSRTTAVSA